jgi:hypothetical protein
VMASVATVSVVTCCEQLISTGMTRHRIAISAGKRRVVFGMVYF